jgi:putative intracellular protease/amidase
LSPSGREWLHKQYLATIEDLKHPRVLEAITEDHINTFDGLFLPGGHGPMQDLARSEALGRIIRWMHGREKLIVAVCHGPAGFLPALQSDGTRVFRGYRLTAFTNEEEAAVGLADKVPFLLETRLRELGGEFEPGRPWMPHVVADRNLVTGQTPASSAGVAQEALARLGVAVPS